MTDLAVGGAQLMNLRLARALVRRGWEVQLAVLFERPTAPFVEQRFYAGLPLCRLGARDMLGKMLLPWRLVGLARKADLVIGGLELAATNYGFVAARIARRPFVSWTHIAFGRHQLTAGPLDRLVSHGVYRLCQDVVFPSCGALESLSQALGGKPDGARWQVIENFLEPAPPRSARPPDQRICTKPVLLGVGRLTAQKAFERLIRAHVALRAQGIDHNLVILGDGPERERLRALIKKEGAEPSAFLMGHTDNIWPWLYHAHVFAVCSHYEGFSLVLLEAMAAGLPCVAMDCESGPREILQDGAYGLLTPADDEIAFQAALARLFRDPHLRSELAMKARARAEHYTEDRIVPQWEELFRKLIKERNPWN